MILRPWKKLKEAKERIKELEVFIETASVSSGVCMCGEEMENHSSAYDCGHEPVDMWDYHKEGILNGHD